MELKNLLDVLLVAFLIYLVLVFIRQTRSFVVLSMIAVLTTINFVAYKLDLVLTRELFQPLLTSFVVVFVVVFQKEIRRFFDWLTFPTRRRWLGHSTNAVAEIPAIIVEAGREMVKRKIGALIVLAGDYPLETLTQGGFSLGGTPSVPLILSIFDPSSPGHDGAIIIEQGVIKSFGVHLPLADNFKFFANLGTRHRAALGITERTDALAIVLSEEKRTISVARGTTLETVESPHDLEHIIRQFLKTDEVESRSPRGWFRWRNLSTATASLVLALLLWYLI
jgi:uncharacterized protein (TIGR00159 family)